MLAELSQDDMRLELAHCYRAAQTGPDPSNQNAAVILCVDRRRIVTAINAPPEEFRDEAREIAKDREKKYLYFEHAERAAVYAAAAAGTETNAATIVCPWAACAECARAIILSGISRLVVHKQRMETTPERWKASVDGGLQMLRDAGVEIVEYDGAVGGTKILVNGELWQP